jgi:Flp pilus assembly protein TadG
MTRRHAPQARRRGSAVVEAAIALPMFFLMLLGILEYSRYVMVRNLADHAAREGARTAVVHSYDQTTSQIQSLVVSRLAGQDGQLSGLAVQVYKADPATGRNLGLWTDARFGEWIMVQVTGTYRPALPNFLQMSSTIPVKGQVMMRCEAN